MPMRGRSVQTGLMAAVVLLTIFRGHLSALAVEAQTKTADEQPKKDPDRVPAALEPESAVKVKRGTVYLRVTGRDREISQGSGFFAMERGLIVTNAHVLDMLQPNAAPPRSVEVVVFSGTADQLKITAEVLAADGEADLAILRVVGKPDKLPDPLVIDLDRCKLTELQKVYIFGFPFGSDLGKEITATESSVSSLRYDTAGVLEKIQVNGGLHPGNSGGPVVDGRGVVVGVAVAGIKNTTINFAVPSPKLQGLLQGRVGDAQFGRATLQEKSISVPVTLSVVDPLQRIREVTLEVWSGPAGKARPAASSAPASMPGDSARKSLAIERKEGVFRQELKLPLDTLPASHVYYVQPVQLSTTGVKNWGRGVVFDPVESRPLDKEAAELKMKATVRDRDLKVSTRFEFKVRDKVLFTDTMTVQAVESYVPTLLRSEYTSISRHSQHWKRRGEPREEGAG
jgi:S1-C subfamily serine protease